MTKNVALEKQYKDHIVDNPITDLREKMLPPEARAVHLQPVRNLEITIQVLEEQTEKVIETITGKATDGSIKLDSSSLTRRTGSITLSVDPDLFPEPDSLIWFGNIIRVYAGLKDLTQNGKTLNFLLGTFWIDEGSYSIDETKSTITVELSDKMTKYDEEQLNYPLEIPENVPITDAMRLVMENVGETRFKSMTLIDKSLVVPYKLEYGIGTEVQDVIKDIRDMYMDWVCGYDVMGNFEFKKIAVQQADEVAEPKWRFDSSDNDRADLTMEFSEGYNLKNIRNHIVVYGGANSRTGESPVGEVRITDASSPFNIDAIGSRKMIVVEDNLVTNEQCISKARFDIWKKSNFQETASITALPVYILDADDIIEVTHPHTKKVSRYRVDSFDLGLGVDATMSISAHKLYYIGLEYGERMIPIVENFIKGINNWGWLSLAEERIKDVYNIMGSGQNQLSIRFTEGDLGGTQASVTSYATTKTQTMMIDIKDFEGLDPLSEDGDNGRTKGDYADRVLGHEMFHAVTNDYIGHEKVIDMPNWFKEGFAELLHGAKERFTSVNENLSDSEKRQSLTTLARSLLRGSWSSSSADYVASYLIAIAIYRVTTQAQWDNLFINLRSQENLAINFLTKLLPIAETSDGVIDILMAEIETMDDVWGMLFDETDTDTGSIAGYHFMNLYNTRLTAESVFNNSGATTDSLGFSLQIHK